MGLHNSNDSVNSIYGNIEAATPTSNIYGTTPHNSDVGIGIANSPMGAAPTAINGSADTAPIKSEDDKQRATALIEAMERNIARMSPKAAESLPRVTNLMSAAELEKVRFDVAKIEYDLASKENMEVAQGLVSKMIVASGIGAGAGLLAANNASNSLAPFAMAETSKDKSADKAPSAEILPINKEFERLLAGLSRPVMPHVTDAQHTDIASLGAIGLSDKLPDLKVAERAADRAQEGRVRSLAT